MDGLKGLIRNLAIILLLASFLEMLLPNKKMRGYVQLVMGLFVIAAIIHPLSEILRMPLTMGVPAWQTVTQQDLPVLADGNNAKSSPINEQYRLILTNQIQALVLGIEGVSSATVEVELERTSNEILQQPKISRVDITLTETEITIQPIKPVIIGDDPGEVANERNHLVEKVKERVVTLMQIPEEKLNIEITS